MCGALDFILLQEAAILQVHAYTGLEALRMEAMVESFWLVRSRILSQWEECSIYLSDGDVLEL